MEDQETPIENLLREGKDLRRDIASLKERIQNSLPNKTHLHNQSETAPEGELLSATIQEDMPTKTPSSKEALQATISIGDDDARLQDGGARTFHLPKESRTVTLAKQVKDFGLRQVHGALAEEGISLGALSYDIKNGIAESWGTKEVKLPEVPAENISIQTAPILPKLNNITLEDEPRAVLENKIQKITAEITARTIILETNNKALANLQKTEESIAADIANEPLISKEDGEKILAVIREKREILEKAIKKVTEEYESLKKEQAAIENRFALVPPETPITPSTQPDQKAEEKPLFNKENLSPFEQGIVNQESIESLTELLVSKEYKDHVFGSGTRAVTGAEMAKRISEKVIQAKKGSQVDPYFFIPDAILANKLHELLGTSLSWQESVSKFGTLSFEKKDSEIKEETAQKAIENTIRKVEAVTNPGMWKKMMDWIKTGGQTKELSATQARAPFWVLLGAIGFWGATEVMDTEKTSMPISTPIEAAAENSQSNAKTQGMDKLFKEAKSSSTNASTPAPAAGIPAQLKPDAKPLTVNTPVEIPTQPEVDVTPITDTPESGVPTQPEVGVVPADTQVAENDPAETFFPAQVEKPVAAQEKPAQFYSVNEMRNWFSQDKQKLAAFERVLHYADGQEEKGANGQPNVRAFWWETMQLQKVGTMLPNKASSKNRNLTREYINYHIHESGSRDTIIELRGLDDNQFMTTGAKLRDFDVWCKNSLFPATQQLEQKITQEEKEILADTTQTLGEYLTHVVYLGEKYGVQIKGIPTLTEAQQQKVQNFQPVKVADKTSTANNQNVVSQERNEPPTENTYWADGALRSAELHGVGNNTSNLEWLNGPYENMIRQYWDIQSDMKINHRGYTLGELRYLKGQFEELRRRADWPSTQGSLRQVDRVLADIETQLGAFQK
jgi:hypothetical protein